jgi:uncharacterized protein
MKTTITSMLVLCAVFGLQAQTDEYTKSVEKYREQTHRDFSDSSETPLTKEGLKDFKGLAYFEIDSVYRVFAKLTLTPNEDVFKMKTSTERLPEHVKYGEAEFEIKGKKLKLNAYQNVKLSQDEKYKDYLFIPFRDFTSGETTYGGGRFLDVDVPNGNTLIVDFNKAYNPYCAYNHKYSCPIPPLENTLEMEINAGEKVYPHH